MTPNRKALEILAPAGNYDSLLAAVRCGANAVYLGGRQFSARAGADNFEETQLPEAVSYCHARDVKVYQAINTLLFDNELDAAGRTIEAACTAGIDALIVQDLAVAVLARQICPEMPLHASTQMSVHNLDGVRQLEAMGFSRVVLARELSRNEIREIAVATSLPLECFVHGALCMSVSGQCYMSSMIGGRSGNRGQCAQPCRLPFEREGATHGLSLRDLSLVECIRDLEELGVSSLKIEGRLKRPEYVAAAVTACRMARSGDSPDLQKLEAVFSRSGFTRGYYEGKSGEEMFGTRRRDDVVAAATVLNDLAALYRNEQPLVPVVFVLQVASGSPSRLTVMDRQGRTAVVEGEPPQAARTAPTTSEKAKSALSKTGGTPYIVENITCHIGEELMLPVSVLNALRRQALEELTALRSRPSSSQILHGWTVPEPLPKHRPRSGPNLRVRLQSVEQLSPELYGEADVIILPLDQLFLLAPDQQAAYRPKMVIELPRLAFDSSALDGQLARAKECGAKQVLSGNLGTLRAGVAQGFQVHGDFGLNCTNRLSLEEHRRLGLSSITLSYELELTKAARLGGALPRGLLAYGYLPLMLTRNAPGGFPLEQPGLWLTDRKGNRFWTSQGPGDGYQIHNCVPLYLADRVKEVADAGMDFITLYFTWETAAECLQALRLYRGESVTAPEQKTRGLYYRRVY